MSSPGLKNVVVQYITHYKSKPKSHLCLIIVVWSKAHPRANATPTCLSRCHFHWRNLPTNRCNMCQTNLGTFYFSRNITPRKLHQFELFTHMVITANTTKSRSIGAKRKCEIACPLFLATVGVIGSYKQ